MEVIIDANFAISCVRRKIDFVSELSGMGFKIVVPREVLQEMKDIKGRQGESFEDRSAVDIFFKIVDDLKIKKIKIGSGKVDDMLIKKGKEGFYIATLDAVIKRSVPNKIIINSSRKALEVIRD